MNASKLAVTLSACPRCHAKPGEWCRTPRGKRTYVHGDRDWLVRAAFAEGRHDGYREGRADGYSDAYREFGINVPVSP